MERRCFASDGERAVRPAFGAYTGGLSIRVAVLLSNHRVSGEAFSPLRQGVNP
jgi:uncharacterized protein